MYCKWNNCHFSSTSLKTLYDHSIKHEGTDPFYCQWENCTQLCHKRARLNAHLLTHIPYRAFTCKICSRSFKREQEMRRHFVSLHISDQFSIKDMATNHSEEAQDKMSLNQLLN